MAFKAGTTTKLYLANGAGSLQDLSAYIDNLDVPQTVEQLETTAFGNASRSFIVGLSDGDTISMSGPYDVTIHSHLTGMKAAQAAGSAAFPYIFGPGGSVASQARSAGSVFVASYQLSSSVGGRVEYSASLQVSGAVANGTF